MKSKFAKMKLIVGTIVLAALYLSVQEARAQACTHYASPAGNGVGTSSNSPFKIVNFWPLAKPGYTLCLLDGQYTGSSSMINPPQNLSGTASARITVRALNDGKVTINGLGSSRPVRLYYNSYFVLEGFNARNSVGNVIDLSNSNHNIVRRVAAWDAADNNTNIFGIRGNHNLLEDVAGWGIARKIFSASQGGNYTTIRRAWGRWEGSHVVGPKMTYTLAYNNYNLTCENCIGTWSGQRMKKTYTLLDYYGKPWTGNGGGTYSNYGVNQPYAIFSVDRLDGNKNAQSKLLGSIAYIRGTDRFAAAQAILITRLDSFEVANTTVYIEPGSHTTRRRFGLNNLISSVGRNLIARNLTGVGGAASSFGSDWQESSISEGSSLGSVSSVFTSTGSANLCKRYKDRALTAEPLWPWPMNQRIMNAMVESGRTSVDVTKTIESMFGAIPSACKGTATNVASATTPASSTTTSTSDKTLTVPSSPLNLKVGP
ncbi:MAG: hypothetical protein GEU77_04080 [Deltaproteobacteria bacterium]|nr:hypothetical protein [Deltaproteobacteria bacterium]